METFDVYKDIATRCGGDIYVGVVGPVRSGKSTFITKFLNELVIPNISDENKKQRTIDEMPQSAGGKTIMTTQPKFVPNEAVEITINQEAKAKVRMIDCVGYLIDGVMGHLEGEKPRLVKTPWSNKDIPFEKAAELGTEKVICEHSTIGILITSDGSITDIARANYVKAEERVVKELKKLGKPFVVVLNSRNPLDATTQKIRLSLEEKYGVPVLALDVQNMNIENINTILQKLLMEFPIRKIKIDLPKWMQALGFENDIVQKLLGEIKKSTVNMTKMSEYVFLPSMCSELTEFKKPVIKDVNLSNGKVAVEIDTTSDLYYKVLSDECNIQIKDDYELISYIKHLAMAKMQYDKFKVALDEVAQTGYGVVLPTKEEMSLDMPEVVKQGSKFGVKLKAKAPSIHIMKVDVSAEVNPMVGTEEQSQEMKNYLLNEFKEHPEDVWQTNMFGKSLLTVVNEGFAGKLNNMPDDAREKMRKALTRILNEGKGGVICILL